MMKKALIVTVGISENVENAIFKSLTHHNPGIVLFLVSKASKSTLERSIGDKKIVDLYPHRIYEVEEEDISGVYFRCKEAIDELLKNGFDSSEIYVDFTSGTKVMSAVLASLALLYGLASLTYVTGKRDQNGKVIRGSEIVLGLRPLDILLDMEMRKVIEFITIYQYKAALQIITRIKEYGVLFDEEKQKRIEELEHLIRGMQSWDLFDHKTALEELKKLDSRLNEQIEWLKSLRDEIVMHAKKMPELKGKLPTPKLIVDICANADRRAQEGNYDDGIARLYRGIEMVAQYELIRRFKLNPSNIDLDEIGNRRADLKLRYKSIKESSGIIQLGLLECFELLCELDPDSEIAKIYTAKKEDMKKYLSFRNNSILAHGFEPLDYEKYMRLRALMISIASSCVEELEKRIEYVLKMFGNAILYFKSEHR